MVSGRQRTLAVAAGVLAVLSLGSVWSSEPATYLPGWCVPNWDGPMTCTYGMTTPGSFSNGFSSPARVFVAIVVVLVALAWRRPTPQPLLRGAAAAALAGAAINGASWGSGHTLLVAAGVLLLVAARATQAAEIRPEPSAAPN